MKQKNTSSKKAVLYARVSSKEQEREGYSIPAQKKLLSSYAQKHGYQIIREFIENGGDADVVFFLLPFHVYHLLQASL